MKLAIISDTHLGDPHCTLIQNQGGSFTAGSKYNEFIEAAGKDNDYLILLGDIMDFSVTSYENAYNTGKAFFKLIKKDKIAKQIVYVPGNHDYEIWSVVENEANIIYQIKNGKLPRKFKMAVPGIIDDRKNTKTPGFTLPGVEINKGGVYGGLFLDSITMDYDNKTKSLKGQPSHFVFAYPNLYLVTDNDSVLMTHGQYLEMYWSLLSKWAPVMFKSDLKIGSAMDIMEMVSINFPLNQLACSGVGQAGVLSNLLSELQGEVKKGEITKSQEYLDNLDNYLDDNVFKYKWYQFFNEASSDLLSNKIKDVLIDTLSSQKEVRFNEQFLNDPEVKKRFNDYYNASYVEIDDLKRFYNISIPAPQTVIFGHTHEPISWNNPNPFKALPSTGSVVRLYNTGGWLMKEVGNNQVFCGAEVFKYETGKGLSSVSIR